MNAYIELVGFTASVMSFVLGGRRPLSFGSAASAASARGVSTSSQLLLQMNACLWGAYAVGTGSLWVGAPGLINGPLAIVTIVLLRHARRAAATAAS